MSGRAWYARAAGRGRQGVVTRGPDGNRSMERAPDVAVAQVSGGSAGTDRGPQLARQRAGRETRRAVSRPGSGCPWWGSSRTSAVGSSSAASHRSMPVASRSPGKSMRTPGRRLEAHHESGVVVRPARRLRDRRRAHFQHAPRAREQHIAATRLVDRPAAADQRVPRARRHVESRGWGTRRERPRGPRCGPRRGGRPPPRRSAPRRAPGAPGRRGADPRTDPRACRRRERGAAVREEDDGGLTLADGEQPDPRHGRAASRCGAPRRDEQERQSQESEAARPPAVPGSRPRSTWRRPRTRSPRTGPRAVRRGAGSRRPRAALAARGPSGRRRSRPRPRPPESAGARGTTRRSVRR